MQPGTIKSVHRNAVQPVRQWENMKFFLLAARNLGVSESSLFKAQILNDGAFYKRSDMDSVLTCIYAYGRLVQTKVLSFTGPQLSQASLQPSTSIGCDLNEVLEPRMHMIPNTEGSEIANTSQDALEQTRLRQV